MLLLTGAATFLHVHPTNDSRSQWGPQAPGSEERLHAALCLPPRYTSSVKYDSERHFIDDVQLPLGLAVASCSQTVTCVPNGTWRNYKAEVRFEPRHRPTRFLSTTIVYPKYPKAVYTTTLDYNCRKTLRRFLSSVELEAVELLGSDDLSDEC